MGDTVRVRISYSPNKEEIGTVQELPADIAGVKIREGRAVLYTDEMAAQDEAVRAAESRDEGASVPVPALPTPQPQDPPGHSAGEYDDDI